MKLRTSHRIITGAAALSLAFATPLALPGVVVPTAMAQTASTIDKLQKASLTVHKFSGSETGENNNGTLLDPGPTSPGNPPLDGVGFTVQKISGLDIHSNADWDLVNKNKGNTDFSKWTNKGDRDIQAVNVTNGSEKKTRAGKAEFTDLDLGFYLVTETTTLDGYTQSAPFIVALPMTHPDGDKWNYAVHVYPKNKKKFVTDKTVTDESSHAGDTIEYHIDADIPAVPAEEKLSNMVLTDHLDERLSITSDKVKLQLVTGTEGNESVTEIDKNNFTISVTDVAKNGRKSYVHVEGKGAEPNDVLAFLAKKKQENATAKIRMVLTPTVISLGDKSGEITNDAYVFVGEPGGQTGTKPDSGTPPTPGEDDPGKTPVVKTYMGKVQVTKQDSAGNAIEQTEEGKRAQFQVYNCTLKGEAAEFGSEKNRGKAGTTSGEPLSIGGETTFTADADGKVAINGLHAQDFVDGKPVTPEKNEGYCLVETKAPAGYERLPEPIFFQVKKEAATTMLEFSVKDPDKNAGFELPLTGARGVILFALLGAGLLLLAGFVSRRNKKAAQ